MYKNTRSNKNEVAREQQNNSNTNNDEDAIGSSDPKRWRRNRTSSFQVSNEARNSRNVGTADAISSINKNKVNTPIVEASKEASITKYICINDKNNNSINRDNNSNKKKYNKQFQKNFIQNNYIRNDLYVANNNNRNELNNEKNDNDVESSSNSIVSNETKSIFYDPATKNLKVNISLSNYNSDSDIKSINSDNFSNKKQNEQSYSDVVSKETGFTINKKLDYEIEDSNNNNSNTVVAESNNHENNFHINDDVSKETGNNTKISVMELNNINSSNVDGDDSSSLYFYENDISESGLNPDEIKMNQQYYEVLRASKAQNKVFINTNSLEHDQVLSDKNVRDVKNNHLQKLNYNIKQNDYNKNNNHISIDTYQASIKEMMEAITQMNISLSTTNEIIGNIVDENSKRDKEFKVLNDYIYNINNNKDEGETGCFNNHLGLTNGVAYSCNVKNNINSNGFIQHLPSAKSSGGNPGGREIQDRSNYDECLPHCFDNNNNNENNNMKSTLTNKRGSSNIPTQTDKKGGFLVNNYRNMEIQTSKKDQRSSCDNDGTHSLPTDGVAHHGNRVYIPQHNNNSAGFIGRNGFYFPSSSASLSTSLPLKETKRILTPSDSNEKSLVGSNTFIGTPNPYVVNKLSRASADGGKDCKVSVYRGDINNYGKDSESIKFFSNPMHKKAEHFNFDDIYQPNFMPDMGNSSTTSSSVPPAPKFTTNDSQGGSNKTSSTYQIPNPFGNLPDMINHNHNNNHNLYENNGTDMYSGPSNDTYGERRPSMQGREIRSVERSNNPIDFRMEFPSEHKDIMLNSLDVGAIIKFQNDLMKFQMAYGVLLSPATKIKPSIIELLCSINPGMTMEGFMKLSFSEIEQILRNFILPTSQAQFLRTFKKLLYFNLPKNYMPSVTNFGLFYSYILTYIKWGTDCFEKLAIGNHVANIPPIKTSENGLVKLFIDPIPHNYGKNIITNLGKSSWNDFYEFIHDFKNFVRMNYFLSIQNREFKYMFSGTAYSKFLSQNNMDHDVLYDAEALNTEFSNMNSEEELGGRISDLTKTSDEESTIVEQYSSVEDSDHDLNASRNDNVKKKDPSLLPCFNKVYRDTCTKSGCKFNHSFKIINEEREKIKKLWASKNHSVKNDSSHDEETPKSDGNIKIIRRNDAPPPSMLSSLDMENAHPANSAVSIDDLDNEYCNYQRLRLDSYCNTMKLDWLVDQIHRKGCIVAGNKDLPLQDVLFDTGAVSASYISSRVVEKYKKYLEPYKRDCKGVVRLGATGHSVDVNEYYELELLFRSDNGKDFRNTIKLIHLDNDRNDVVIGWPHIVELFPDLFLDIFQKTRSHLNKNKSTDNNCSTFYLNSSYGETLYPWLAPIDDIAPEENDCPIPCSYPDALHFMEMTPEDAEKEFINQIDEHVSPEFREKTDVVNLLLTKGKKVFIPQNWEGIHHATINVEPLELSFKAGMPDTHKPATRHYNPKILDVLYKELRRLKGYFFEDSTSPICSPMVAATKATKPFVRVCGDYVWVNKWIETRHYPMPQPRKEIERINTIPSLRDMENNNTSVKGQHEVIFHDMDVTNAFHQNLLAPYTASRLSLQTPLGQFQPKFMPEGINVAMSVLNYIMNLIFGLFYCWMIYIHDNILVVSTDYDDAYDKLEKVLDRCIEFNLYLKFSKTWLGFKKIEFFGYVCDGVGYHLSDKRKASLENAPLPKNCKALQSFLGSAQYFAPFIPNYSDLTCPLYDMIHKSFQWNKESWTAERIKVFESIRKACVDSMKLYYPDPDLPKVLQTDASLLGCAYVYFQLLEQDNQLVKQVIALGSKKFSPQARRWDTHKQEAYAIFHAFHKLSYYLRGTDFVVETDHANLLWMENNQTPIVIRWRIFLQSFTFSLKHIPGKNNQFADYLSRYVFDEDPDDFLSSSLPVTLLDGAIISADDMLKYVHGDRMAHHGQKRTWQELNKQYPGHNISFRAVQEYINNCPVCQKMRLHLVEGVHPLHRPIMPEHRRQRVGVDTLTITPIDQSGNNYLTVIVVHPQRLMKMYPSPNRDALAMALALFQFYCTYGVFEFIYSDQGTDLMSDVIKHLHQWFGIRHRFALVDRHESNGVERSNGEILKHIRTLVMDENMQDRWSDPTIIHMVEFIINSQVNSETGIVPFHFFFGTDDIKYFRLPEPISPDQECHEYIRRLDNDLQRLWQLSQQHQRSIAVKRSGGMTPATQNLYQPGDFILHERDTSKPLPYKLASKYEGPFEVIKQEKNDVHCRHLGSDVVHVLFVGRCKIFSGCKKSAIETARYDYQQFVVNKILAFRGNPETRTTCEFLVRFEDGAEIWITYSLDLFKTVPYEHFCRSKPYLFPLVMPAADASKWISTKKKEVKRARARA